MWTREWLLKRPGLEFIKPEYSLRFKKSTMIGCLRTRVLAVPQGCLRFVIVVFPVHTHYFITSRYWMYEMLMRHLREGDVNSFRNFVKMDPRMFNKKVEDLGPLGFRSKLPTVESLCPLDSTWPPLWGTCIVSPVALASLCPTSCWWLLTPPSALCQMCIKPYIPLPWNALQVPYYRRRVEWVTIGLSEKWDFQSLLGF